MQTLANLPASDPFLARLVFELALLALILGSVGAYRMFRTNVKRRAMERQQEYGRRVNSL